MIGLWYVAHLERSPTSVDVPSCVSCGDKPSDHVSVYALPFVEAPYCADCAERARRKEWNIPFAMMGGAFVLPSLVLVQPFGTVSGALLFAFGASFVVPCSYVLLMTFGARTGGAVRAHQLMPAIRIDCARKEVAAALVAACGGFVQPHRSLRLTSAVSFVPLTVFMCVFGWLAANYLFVSTIAIDNAGDRDVGVSIDGRQSIVAPNAHTTVDVRVGRHAIAWKEGRTRQVELDRKHDALVTPGTTTCHRKDAVYTGILSASDRAEVESVGLLPLEEVQVVHEVKHWFGPVPAEKKDELLEPNIELGVTRDDRCAPFLACAAFLDCFRGAKDARTRDACIGLAPSLCRVTP